MYQKTEVRYTCLHVPFKGKDPTTVCGRVILQAMAGYWISGMAPRPYGLGHVEATACSGTQLLLGSWVGHSAP